MTGQLEVKPSADHGRIGHGIADRPIERRRQERVGVQEEKDITAGVGRAGIHLLRPPPLGHAHTIGEPRRHLARAVVTAAIDDNELVHTS